jgi:hypothetical protein
MYNNNLIFLKIKTYCFDMYINRENGLYQKIQNELAPLIGKTPGMGDEKSLQVLFQSAQQAISHGLDPANGEGGWFISKSYSSF